VLVALKSFSPGSAPGLDGLRPLHIEEMLQMSSPEGLPLALVDFINHVLAGGIPLPVCHVFFGASLHALRKKDGGLRPIGTRLGMLLGLLFPLRLHATLSSNSIW